MTSEFSFSEKNIFCRRWLRWRGNIEVRNRRRKRCVDNSELGRGGEQDINNFSFSQFFSCIIRKYLSSKISKKRHFYVLIMML
ncbi:hypothetical protein DRO61_09105 [Candidatus Bathyarchaeota archaeon]|nr:MAG: hypothetical protein DRO61_09105 [Candidatus Bathyarchaeota archaeon]